MSIENTNETVEINTEALTAERQTLAARIKEIDALLKPKTRKRAATNITVADAIAEASKEPTNIKAIIAAVAEARPGTSAQTVRTTVSMCVSAGKIAKTAYATYQWVTPADAAATEA